MGPRLLGDGLVDALTELGGEGRRGQARQLLAQFGALDPAGAGVVLGGLIGHVRLEPQVCVLDVVPAPARAVLLAMSFALLNIAGSPCLQQLHVSNVENVLRWDYIE